MIYLFSFYIIIGIYFFLKILKNPRNFLNLFFFSIIIGSGPMIAGHALLDEYLISMLLIGSFLKIMLVPSQGVIKKSTSFNYSTIHKLFFYLLVFYLFFSCIRGMVVLGDFRMFRWIIFFINLGLISFILNNYRFSINRQQVIKIIFYLSNVYFIIYFLFGLFFEIFLGVNKYDIQGNVWIGTATAALPIILYSISFILFCDEFKTQNIKLKLLLSIIIIFSISSYYDSRSSIIILIFTIIYYFFILFRNKINLILSLPFICIFIILVLFNSSSIRHSVVKYLPYDLDNYEFSIPKKIYGETDKGRIISIKAAHLTINNSPLNFIFGGGWYTARYSIIDAVNKLRYKSGFDYYEGQVYQPSAFNAILVDTGFIGLILFLINLLLSVITIFKCNTKRKFYLSLTLSSIMFFSVIGNFTPLLLSFILIMPNSPIFMMINTNKKNFTKNL